MVYYVNLTSNELRKIELVTLKYLMNFILPSDQIPKSS